MDNRKVILAAVSNNGAALQDASPELQDDREVVLAAVNDFGGALRYASRVLQADREVVLTAVSNFGYALNYASPELKNDREVVLTALSNNSVAYKFGSYELYIEFKNKTHEQINELLNFERKQKNQRSQPRSQPRSQQKSPQRLELLDIMSRAGCELRRCYPETRADREVVLTAVTNNGLALQYASPELRADREVVLTAINNNIKALENFSQVINRFPDSKYARDSEQKILLVKELCKSCSVSSCCVPKSLNGTLIIKASPLIRSSFNSLKFAPCFKQAL